MSASRVARGCNIDFAVITKTPLQAALLRKLHRLYETTRLERDGQRWTSPKIKTLAEQLGVHHATISRALRQLADWGLILLKRWRWNRSPRLYIRVLVKARRAPAHTERTLTDSQNAHCRHNTRKENTPSGNTCGSADASPNLGSVLSSAGSSGERPTSPQSPPSPRRQKLRGSLRDVGSRLTERRGDPEPGYNDDPRKIGAKNLHRRWARLLREYDASYLPDDKKTLRHIGLVRDRLAERGVNVWDVLPHLILNWIDYAPKRAGKDPVPWAALRALDAYVEYRDAMGKPTVSAPERPAEPHPTPSPAQPPVKQKEGFMGALKRAQEEHRKKTANEKVSSPKPDVVKTPKDNPLASLMAALKKPDDEA